MILKSLSKKSTQAGNIGRLMPLKYKLKANFQVKNFKKTEELETSNGGINKTTSRTPTATISGSIVAPTRLEKSNRTFYEE